MVPDSQAVKVLVADDDGPFCDVMRAHLSMKPYVAEVKTTQTGLQALYSCIDFQPDVVFIDSLMPAMDGKLLGSKVRSLLPEARLVSISGSREKEPPEWANAHVLKSGTLFDDMQSHVLGD